MKIIFAGGRNFTSVNAIRKILTYLTEMRIINYKEKITGVSGKAKGADTMFAEELKKFNIPVEEYPAKWDDLGAEPCVIGINNYGDSYNKLAGHNRNTLMAQNADILVCVYEGSAGTKHMINAMKKLGKLTYIFDYNGLPVY
jgi:hypothetical protein|tara:strand:+ start:24 stop:449 length:426 start_codon:yes stop_codon:yes gene_type:complete